MIRYNMIDKGVCLHPTIMCSAFPMRRNAYKVTLPYLPLPFLSQPPNVHS